MKLQFSSDEGETFRREKTHFAFISLAPIVHSECNLVARLQKKGLISDGSIIERKKRKSWKITMETLAVMQSW